MRTPAICCAALLLTLAVGCGDDESNPEIGSGLPRPVPGIYDDFGVADTSAGIRALIGFATRDVEGLDRSIEAMYDPEGGSFRQYMTVDEWMAQHAPPEENLQKVEAWLGQQGFTVAARASNRLLLEITGTVGQFNEAFQTELHLFERENPSAGGAPLPVYGVVDKPLRAPPDIGPLITGVITADVPVDTRTLPNEGGDIETAPPPDVASSLSIAQVAHAYGADALYADSYDGSGVKLGIVVGATFKFKDLQSFWQSFGVTRENPTVVQTLDDISTRYLETTLDVEWAAGLAPGADVLVYSGPDARNTSVLFTYNEAIALGEVSVLTSSFAHREETEADLVRNHFNDSSRMGAALGMTIVVASGDSARTDIPSSSPYVTCVGGTKLTLSAAGEVAEEVAWSGSGSGAARTFPMPWYQEGVVTDSEGKRAVTDLSLNASQEPGFWVYYIGEWKGGYGGTSFSAPVFAGLITLVAQHRLENGKPPLGLLNPFLYQSAEVQATFRDIVSGKTEFYPAKPGWDYPTGWGAPNVAALAEALP